MRQPCQGTSVPGAPRRMSPCLAPCERKWPAKAWVSVVDRRRDWVARIQKDNAVQAATMAIWACAFFMVAASGQAKPADQDRADAQALDLAKQAIAVRSVNGDGDQ